MRTRALGLFAAWCAVSLVGCTVDRSGLRDRSDDGSAGRDGDTVAQDAGDAGELVRDSAAMRDARPGDGSVSAAEGGADGCSAACPWGCLEDETVCREIPNLPDSIGRWMEEATGELSLGSGRASVELEGDEAGEIESSGEDEVTYRDAGVGLDVTTATHFQIVHQSDEVPDLAVLVVRRLVIPEGATLEVEGSRSVLVVATEDLVIAGTIDVSADGREPGSGGYAPDDGPGEGFSGPESSSTGGGGAGFGAVGGSGGGDDTMLTGGMGGMSYGDGSLEPLRGGSGGSHGHGDEETSGGGGGGAIQLVAGGRLEVTGTGAIIAGGGGGSCAPGSGGGGGGSGGAIFLAAPEVRMTGLLSANGGGGGSGDGFDEDSWQCRGSDGDASSMPAPGGVAASGSATGGAGGAGSDIGGQPGDTEDQGGGGGGGAAGRIRIVSWDVPLGGTGTFSPAAATEAVRFEGP